MTERFVSAAELMSRVLGMEGYQFAVIPHPISSASEAGLSAMADMTTEQVLRLLMQPKSDGVHGAAP
jgi:hypothetical protein